MIKQTRLVGQYNQLAEVLFWDSLEDVVEAGKDEVSKLLEVQRENMKSAQYEYEKALLEVASTKDNLAELAAYVSKLERLLT